MRVKSLLAAAVAGVGLMVGSVQAATTTDLVDNIVTSYPAGTEVRPVVFEDNDYSLLVDVDQSGDLSIGDIITGIIRIQEISRAVPNANPLDPFPVIPTDPQQITAVAGFELTAVYELAVVSIGPGGIQLGVPAAYNYALAGLGVPAGTVVSVYEDTNLNFSSNQGFAADVANASDGTLYANIGFTGVGTEFYTIIPAPSGFPFSELVALSLNFTTEPPPIASGYPILLNSFGTQIAGQGSLSAMATNPSGWDRASDIDFVVMYVPLPASAWTGLTMLAGLGAAGAIRRIRRSA